MCVHSCMHSPPHPQHTHHRRPQQVCWICTENLPPEGSVQAAAGLWGKPSLPTGLLLWVMVDLRFLSLSSWPRHLRAGPVCWSVTALITDTSPSGRCPTCAVPGAPEVSHWAEATKGKPAAQSRSSVCFVWLTLKNKQTLSYTERMLHKNLDFKLHWELSRKACQHCVRPLRVTLVEPEWCLSPWDTFASVTIIPVGSPGLISAPCQAAVGSSFPTPSYLSYHAWGADPGETPPRPPAAVSGSILPPARFPPQPPLSPERESQWHHWMILF